MKKNFFYKIESLQLMTEILAMNNTERGRFVTQLAVDLSGSDTDTAKTALGKALIIEANAFREKKALAGRSGGLAKASSAIAKSSIPLANSSNSNNSSNNTEQKEETTPTTGGEDLSLPELKTIYSETFRDLLPTKAVLDRLQWMIDNFSKDEIMTKFEGASSAKAKSLNYITNGMKKELEGKDAEEEMWANMGEDNAS